MFSNRKLLTEVEKVVKKVSELIQECKFSVDKIKASSNNKQKEKYETEHRNVVRKLQRYREQIRSWLAANDVKNKEKENELIEWRKEIEEQMVIVKMFEKERKTKAYSKEGLLAEDENKEKIEMENWVNKCLDLLHVQVETAEAEWDGLGRKDVNRKEELDKLLTSHRKHISTLEQILRLVDNGVLEIPLVNEIREDIEYYIEFYEEDDFIENESLYECLALENVPQELIVKEDEDIKSAHSHPQNPPTPCSSKSVSSTMPPSDLLPHASPRTPVKTPYFGAETICSSTAPHFFPNHLQMLHKNIMDVAHAAICEVFATDNRLKEVLKSAVESPLPQTKILKCSPKTHVPTLHLPPGLSTVEASSPQNPSVTPTQTAALSEDIPVLEKAKIAYAFAPYPNGLSPSAFQSIYTELYGSKLNVKQYGRGNLTNFLSSLKDIVAASGETASEGNIFILHSYARNRIQNNYMPVQSTSSREIALIGLVQSVDPSSHTAKIGPVTFHESVLEGSVWDEVAKGHLAILLGVKGDTKNSPPRATAVVLLATDHDSPLFPLEDDNNNISSKTTSCSATPSAPKPVSWSSLMQYPLPEPALAAEEPALKPDTSSNELFPPLASSSSLSKRPATPTTVASTAFPPGLPPEVRRTSPTDKAGPARRDAGLQATPAHAASVVLDPKEFLNFTTATETQAQDGTLVSANQDAFAAFKAQITRVLRAHPQGVSLSQFPAAFYESTNEKLNLKRYGYSKLSVLVQDIPELVVVDPKSHGNLVLKPHPSILIQTTSIKSSRPEPSQYRLQDDDFPNLLSSKPEPPSASPIISGPPAAAPKPSTAPISPSETVATRLPPGLKLPPGLSHPTAKPDIKSPMLPNPPATSSPTVSQPVSGHSSKPSKSSQHLLSDHSPISCPSTAEDSPATQDAIPADEFEQIKQSLHVLVQLFPGFKEALGQDWENLMEDSAFADLYLSLREHYENQMETPFSQATQPLTNAAGDDPSSSLDKTALTQLPDVAKPMPNAQSVEVDALLGHEHEHSWGCKILRKFDAKKVLPVTLILGDKRLTILAARAQPLRELLCEFAPAPAPSGRRWAFYADASLTDMLSLSITADMVPSSTLYYGLTSGAWWQVPDSFPKP
eukprot:GCRY01003859.1.p1 GENE.GCRY01003859.1~~GCRY01003859.1.p1  ORF type:complete len:1126 (+),score=188.68 GCRY01003859.1:109-3486(+)